MKKDLAKNAEELIMLGILSWINVWMSNGLYMRPTI
jgi:hypothetical protein